MAKLYRMLKPWSVLTLYSMVGAKPLSQTLETSRTLDLTFCNATVKLQGHT